MASVTKDFHRLLKRVCKLTDGQVTILDMDWDEGTLQKFNVIIQPNAGLYKNGKFKFEVRIADDYPESPPVVWCHTDIYHPNIDPTEECYEDTSTNVCLNILEFGIWSRSFGLEGLILGLLFLMHNPNLSDPLSPYFEGTDDQETFEENVKRYMAGDMIDETSFDIDFCVKDGVLIEEKNDLKKDETGSLKDENKLKIVTDVMPETENGYTNEIAVTEAINCVLDNVICTVDKTDEVATNCTNNVHNLIKVEDEKATNYNDEQNSDMHKIEKDEEPCAGNIDGENNECKVEADMKDIDEENNECNIELVSIDGEYVFMINRSENDDFDVTQETNNQTETNESVPVDTNTANEINGMTLEINENKTDTENEQNDANGTKEESNLDNDENPETSNLCNAEAIAEDGSNTFYNEHEINDRSPMLETEIRLHDINQESDKKSLPDEVKCACGTWYIIRTAISKIVHTIGHNKLYRDIGI